MSSSENLLDMTLCKSVQRISFKTTTLEYELHGYEEKRKSPRVKI